MKNNNSGKADVNKEQINSTGHNLTELCDKLTEIHETCAFLLEAYEAVCRDAEEMNTLILSGGALFARDLSRKFDELEHLLNKIRTQLT